MWYASLCHFPVIPQSSSLLNPRSSFLTSYFTLSLLHNLYRTKSNSNFISYSIYYSYFSNSHSQAHSDSYSNFTVTFTLTPLTLTVIFAPTRTPRSSHLVPRGAAGGGVVAVVNSGCSYARLLRLERGADGAPLASSPASSTSSILTGWRESSSVITSRT